MTTTVQLPFYGVWHCISPFPHGKGLQSNGAIYHQLIQQEAQWSQRDNTTLYVNWNLVKCCTSIQKNAIEQACNGMGERPWRSLKVIGNDAIRLAIYHFILVVSVNNVVILDYFRDITILQCTWLLWPSALLHLQYTSPNYRLCMLSNKCGHILAAILQGMGVRNVLSSQSDLRDHLRWLVLVFTNKLHVISY